MPRRGTQIELDPLNPLSIESAEWSLLAFIDQVDIDADAATFYAAEQSALAISEFMHKKTGWMASSVEVDQKFCNGSMSYSFSTNTAQHPDRAYSKNGEGYARLEADKGGSHDFEHMYYWDYEGEGEVIDDFERGFWR